MTDKKYLNELKDELNQYKKKLFAVEKSFKEKTGKESTKVYNSLQKVFQEAGVAYENLKSASEEEWGPLKKIASQSLKELDTSFKDLKDSVSEHISDYAHQIEDYSQETLESSIEYIKNNPFRSILLAGGLGFVIGRILK